MNLWMLRRKIHSSWLIGAAAFSTTVGVISAQYLPTGWLAGWVWCCVAVALMVLCLWSRWIMAIPLICVAGCLLGIWRGSIATEAAAPYTRLAGQLLTQHGNVADDTERDAHGLLAMRLDAVVIDGHRLLGTVRASAMTSADIKRGDYVTVKGKLQPGFGGFVATVNWATLVAVTRPEPGVWPEWCAMGLPIKFDR